MGTFYTNITLKGVSAGLAASVLEQRRRAAYLYEMQDCTVVYDDLSEQDMDLDLLEDLTQVLSRELRCPALGVQVYNGDFLYFVAYDHGSFADEYHSDPHYLDSDEPSAPQGGDAAKLCALFGAAGAEARVDYILRNEEIYDFAVERHEDLVKALGLSLAAVDVGYDYIETGDLPAWLSLEREKLVRAANG